MPYKLNKQKPWQRLYGDNGQAEKSKTRLRKITPAVRRGFLLPEILSPTASRQHQSSQQFVSLQHGIHG